MPVKDILYSSTISLLWRKAVYKSFETSNIVNVNRDEWHKNQDVQIALQRTDCCQHKSYSLGHKLTLLLLWLFFHLSPQFDTIHNNPEEANRFGSIVEECVVFHRTCVWDLPKRMASRLFDDEPFCDFLCSTLKRRYQYTVFLGCTNSVYFTSSHPKKNWADWLLTSAKISVDQSRDNLLFYPDNILVLTTIVCLAFL